jgi:hypothetical protein
MTEEELRQYSIVTEVRRAVRETDETDAHEIGRKVAENVPAENLRTALAIACAYLVKVQFARERMTHLRTPTPDSELDALARQREAGIAHSAESPRIKRQQALAERWRETLRLRVHIGNGQRRMLGALTYENLMYAAAERQQIAAQNTANAMLYARLADAVRMAKVTHVQDLPESVLRQALTGMRAVNES